ncbi:MAG TPA: hypothetical protein PLK52_07505 [Usitatibacteraceae bacterium]|jgi:hypothetical protein|nr:hypothetical protein [Usitatibacteraceae bacterium]HRA23391.1 hypothetical protein [Usitatibacteraceae bacterium]
MDMREPARKGFAGREALNAAFWDLGLRFQWDAATWGVLVQMETLEAQLAYYLEHWQPHLLSVYPPAFLANLVETRLALPANSRLGMEAMTRA